MLESYGYQQYVLLKLGRASWSLARSIHYNLTGTIPSISGSYNNHIRTSIPKIAECYTFLIHCWGIFGGKINIKSISENIKCGNLKGNRIIYHNEKKGNGLTGFYGILSNKIMQNYQNNYPQKGVMVIYPDAVVTEKG